MKHFAALLAFALLVNMSANAQCTPDASITQPGFYPSPDSFPCIEQGVAFDTSLQFKNFTTVDAADFGAPFSVLVTINSVKIDTIEGLPSGITYACNPPTCEFAGGANGCIDFSGTTSDPSGRYDLLIYATVNATAPGFGTIEQQGTTADLGLEVYLNVIAPGAPCPAPQVLVANGPFYACGGGPGEQINLFIDTAGAVPPFTYAWSPAAGLDDATLASPTANPTATTTYTVTVTDANGYEFSTSATVFGLPEADFDFTINGTSATFTNQSVGNTTNTWIFGNGETSASASPTQDYGVGDSTFEVTLIVSNTCGSDTIVKTLTTTVGIKDATADLSLDIYPNPTKGMFNVDIKGSTHGATILVFDLQGKMISNTELASQTNTATVDLTNQPSGLYLVKVISGNAVSTRKLFKN